VTADLRVTSRLHDVAPRPSLAVALEPSLTDDIEDLFRCYAPYVARIGLRLLGRRDEVDDLVQDVFEAALLGLRQLRDREAVRPWLAAIAVRKARGQLRRRRLLRYLGFDRDEDYLEVADAGATPVERQLLAAVFRALDDMGADLRVAWSLRHLDGEDLQTIAELCCCSVSTIKRRVELAHALVMEKIRDDA